MAKCLVALKADAEWERTKAALPQDFHALSRCACDEERALRWLDEYADAALSGKWLALRFLSHAVLHWLVVRSRKAAR
jgi:hypothetical protein